MMIFVRQSQEMMRSVAFTVLMFCYLDSARAQISPESANLPMPTPAPKPVTLESVFNPDAASNEPGWSLSAGADLIVMVPRFESNPAYSTTIVQAGPGGFPLTSQRFEEFQYDYALSPRIWLGVESQGGLGARVRWWHFDQNAPTLRLNNSPIPLGSPILSQTVISQSPLMVIGPQTQLPTVLSQKDQGPNPLNASTDAMSFDTSLSMNVLDFEGTLSDVALGQWSFLISGGLRYAHLHQTYESLLQFAPGVPIPPLTLGSTQSFNGLGPTLGLNARRSLDSLGLNLYGGARVGVLFGSDRHSAAGFNYELLPTPSLGIHSSTSERIRALPVIETELGAERVVPMGSFDWILRGGVVTQLWPIGSGAHGNGNMAFIGFTAGTGVSF